jgi:hypothetical protein
MRIERWQRFPGHGADRASKSSWCGPVKAEWSSRNQQLEALEHEQLRDLQAGRQAGSWNRLHSSLRGAGEQLQWLGVLSATMVRYNGWMYKLYAGAYRDENCK